MTISNYILGGRLFRLPVFPERYEFEVSLHAGHSCEADGKR